MQNLPIVSIWFQSKFNLINWISKMIYKMQQHTQDYAICDGGAILTGIMHFRRSFTGKNQILRMNPKGYHLFGQIFWPFQTTIAPFTNVIDCSNHYIHFNALFLVFLFWINREVNDPEWAWRKNVRKTNTTLSEPYEYVRSVSIHKIKFRGELLPTEATRLRILKNSIFFLNLICFVYFRSFWCADVKNNF
jgi:hypothetical protein